MLSPTEAEPERKLAPPRAKFDVAVANMVIHHVDDMAGFMQGLVGLLSPGGWVVFTEFGKKEGLTEAKVSYTRRLGYTLTRGWGPSSRWRTDLVMRRVIITGRSRSSR